MEMFYIPEGEFIMGSEDNKGLENEYPQHSVFLNSFWMDRTEITNAMYEECVKENVCSEPAYLMTMSRDTYFYDDQYNAYPVIAVNWDQANTYCQWVGSRLPTEAEWEKAARGTDGRQYPWGDFSPNESLANCNDNLGDTAEVGSYPEGSSPYGVLDLSGNVFEWVADWYGVYQSDDTKNPLGPSSGENRIIRGGAFELGNIHLRATYRGEIEPEATYFDIGFRCAMDGK